MTDYALLIQKYQTIIMNPGILMHASVKQCPFLKPKIIEIDRNTKRED